MTAASESGVTPIRENTGMSNNTFTKHVYILGKGPTLPDSWATTDRFTIAVNEAAIACVGTNFIVSTADIEPLRNLPKNVYDRCLGVYVPFILHEHGRPARSSAELCSELEAQGIPSQKVIPWFYTCMTSAQLAHAMCPEADYSAKNECCSGGSIACLLYTSDAADERSKSKK